jgi:hypothetical protein
MPNEQIVALLLAERDKLNLAMKPLRVPPSVGEGRRRIRAGYRYCCACRRSREEAQAQKRCPEESSRGEDEGVLGKAKEGREEGVAHVEVLQ